jgi:ribonucleoside-diphosphate reductase alpha chain
MTNPSPKGAPNPEHFHLDSERNGITVRFQFDEDNKGYFIVNGYADGTPGEVTIFMGKVGEFERGFASAWATAISMLLQYGIDPRKIYANFKHIAFEPAGITGVPSVPMAASIVDLIVKYMEINFPPTGGRKEPEELDDYETAINSMSTEEK